MKAWIRDNYYMEKIPALRLKDNALLHIFPVRDDPADSSKSGYKPDLRGLVGVAAVDRDDGIETILWHGEKYEVFSIDLQWENSPDTITPYKELPSKGFVDALNDYCQDYYKHYEGYPVEFEYEGKVYPYEYYVEYIYPSVRDYPVENGETNSSVMSWRIKEASKANAMREDSEI